MHVEMRWHSQDGVLLPVALWCPGPGYRMISSGVAGGGIGPREWVLNAQVSASYARMDPAVHVAELAAGLGLAGERCRAVRRRRGARRGHGRAARPGLGGGAAWHR